MPYFTAGVVVVVGVNVKIKFGWGYVRVKVVSNASGFGGRV